jgi:hypothetical protein
MDWEPISLSELEELIETDLVECAPELKELWNRVRIAPEKWRQSPWGDEGGGFWAVAVLSNRVLWFNDIEYGFNVSQFTTWGEFPDNEYWCNQDGLHFALLQLSGGTGGNFGPPQKL